MSALKPAVEAPDRARASILEKCRKYTVPDEIKAAGVWTYFRTIESGQDPVVTMKGREMVMLGSNNYLGLTSHPKVKEAAVAAVKKYGAGCAGSRFLNGTLDIHIQLEERLAAFMKKPACITFSTGFLANLGVIGTLPGKGDTIFLDRQDHACIYDGARLAVGAEVRKFKHNDAADFDRLLRNHPDKGGRLLVVGDRRRGRRGAAPARRPRGERCPLAGVSRAGRRRGRRCPPRPTSSACCGCSRDRGSTSPRPAPRRSPTS